MTRSGITVDGVAHDPHPEPGLELATYLHEELGVTSVRSPCETARCGACTVLVDGRAVKSCTIVVGQVNGCDVRTAFGTQHDPVATVVREEFARGFAVQCGYCTPGMLVAARALLARTPRPTDEQIRAGLRGNLCRCTGYQNIVASIRAAADRLAAAEELR